MSIISDPDFPSPTYGTVQRLVGATFEDEQMIAVDANGVAGPDGVQVIGVAGRPAPDGPVGFGEGVGSFRGDGTVTATTRPGAKLYRVDPHTLSATSNGSPAGRLWEFDPINFPDRPVLTVIGRILGAELLGL